MGALPIAVPRDRVRPHTRERATDGRNFCRFSLCAAGRPEEVGTSLFTGRFPCGPLDYQRVRDGMDVAPQPARR